MDNRMLVIVKAGRADFADASVDGILTAKGRQRDEQRREGEPHPSALRAATTAGLTGPVSLKTAHSAVFRALNAP